MPLPGLQMPWNQSQVSGCRWQMARKARATPCQARAPMPPSVRDLPTGWAHSDRSEMFRVRNIGSGLGPDFGPGFGPERCAVAMLTLPRQICGRPALLKRS